MKKDAVRPPPWGQPESWRLCGSPGGQLTSPEQATCGLVHSRRVRREVGGRAEATADEARAVWSLAWGLDATRHREQRVNCSTISLFTGRSHRASQPGPVGAGHCRPSLPSPRG